MQIQFLHASYYKKNLRQMLNTYLNIISDRKEKGNGQTSSEINRHIADSGALQPFINKYANK